jgi:CIC family chloride channel protein
MLSFRWLNRLDPTPRLILFAVFLGLIGGFGAQLFLWLLHMGEVLILTPLSGYHFLTVAAASHSLKAPGFRFYWGIPLATTVGGLLAGVLVYRFAPEAEGHGTDAVVQAFHERNGYIRPRVPLVKTLASAITIGSGGSAGREGPTAQIAAGVGSIVGRFCKLSKKERRYVVLMGVAAGLSAIFKSPLGTAIFAVEILYAGVAFEGDALLYTLIASAVAYAVTGAIEGWTPLFVLPKASFGTPLDLVWYGILGILAGSIGAFLPTVFYGIRDFFRRLRIPNHFKPAIGGLAVGLIGAVLPGILGGGYGYMQLALEGAAGLSIGFLLLLMVGKIVTLSLTIGSGGSGGVFAPTLFIGVFLGAAASGFLRWVGIHQISETALAVVGMAAVFAGAARVPIAALIMVTEMTGGYHLIVPTMLAVALSYFVQLSLSRRHRYPTLYEAQVQSPMESPVHRRLYYETVTELLRRHKLQLDEDLISNQLLEQLSEGHGISLGRTGERLYRLHLAPGAPIAGAEIRSLGLEDLLIMSIIRSDHSLIPKGGTVLQVGDELLVCATPGALESFTPRLAAQVTPDAATAGPPPATGP